MYTTYATAMPTAREIKGLRFEVEDCAAGCLDRAKAVADAYKDLNNAVEDMIDMLWELQYAIGEVKDALDDESTIVCACEGLYAEIEGVKENIEDDTNDIDRRTKAEIEKLLKGNDYNDLNNMLKILEAIL